MKKLHGWRKAHFQEVKIFWFMLCKGKKCIQLKMISKHSIFKIRKIIGYFSTLMARASYLVSESDRTLGSQCIHLKTDILSHLLCHRELSKFILEIIRLTWGHWCIIVTYRWKKTHAENNVRISFLQLNE